MNVLQVVAHPDDECLWAGGLMARFASQGHRLTFVCASAEATGPHGSPARRREFLASCRVLGAEGIVLADAFDEDSPRRVARWLELNGDRFCLLVTHSPDGDPNLHREHRVVHGVVADYAAHAAHPWLWTFGCGPSGGDTSIALTPAERAIKRRAVECHASQRDFIARDLLWADTPVEAFRTA